MSRRVGLRHMQSIGAKKPCPSGEQIVNGGFETGDFTGWTVTNPVRVLIYSYSPYEGLYYVHMKHQYGDPDSSISQDLLNLVPKACLTDSSIFNVALLGTYNECGHFGNQAIIRITYSDDTYTDVNWEAPNSGWNVLDLKGYVEAGKTVKNIKISFKDDWGYMEVDACSCVP